MKSVSQKYLIICMIEYKRKYISRIKEIEKVIIKVDFKVQIMINHQLKLETKTGTTIQQLFLSPI